MASAFVFVKRIFFNDAFKIETVAYHLLFDAVGEASKHSQTSHRSRLNLNM